MMWRDPSTHVQSCAMCALVGHFSKLGRFCIFQQALTLSLHLVARPTDSSTQNRTCCDASSGHVLSSARTVPEHPVTRCVPTAVPGHALDCPTAHNVSHTVHNMSHHVWSMWHIKISMLLFVCLLEWGAPSVKICVHCVLVGSGTSCRERETRGQMEKALLLHHSLSQSFC